MNISKFCSELDQLFELTAGAVKPTDSLQQITGWDSLTFMSLIAMVDEEYGVTLKPAAVLDTKSVAELVRLIGEGDSDTKQAA